jgi:hypothetical protein
MLRCIGLNKRKSYRNLISNENLVLFPLLIPISTTHPSTPPPHNILPTPPRLPPLRHLKPTTFHLRRLTLQPTRRRPLPFQLRPRIHREQAQPYVSHWHRRRRGHRGRRWDSCLPSTRSRWRRRRAKLRRLVQACETRATCNRIDTAV